MSVHEDKCGVPHWNQFNRSRPLHPDGFRAQTNSSEVAGGAIFHTGHLRVANSSFFANRAGADGPAVMSIGLLERLSNVLFSENAHHCRAGKYGYIKKERTETFVIFERQQHFTAGLAGRIVSPLCCNYNTVIIFT